VCVCVCVGIGIGLVRCGQCRKCWNICYQSGRFSALILILFASFALSTGASGAAIPFLDDFEDGDATDGMPVSWAIGSDGPATLEVVNGEYVVSPTNLSLVVSSFVEETDVFPDNTGDVSVRTKLRLLGRVQSAGVFARGTPGGSYFAGITDPEGRAFVGTTGGTFLLQDVSDPNLLDPSEPMFVQLDVQQVGGVNTVSVTAWQAGDTMPLSPLLSFNDPTPRVGSIGVFVDAASGVLGSVAFDDYSAVPEPASATLMGLALLVSISTCRRKTRFA